jgi:hypothetical protein
VTGSLAGSSDAVQPLIGGETIFYGACACALAVGWVVACGSWYHCSCELCCLGKLGYCTVLLQAFLTRTLMSRQQHPLTHSLTEMQCVLMECHRFSRPCCCQCCSCAWFGPAAPTR